MKTQGWRALMAGAVLAAGAAWAGGGDKHKDRQQQGTYEEQDTQQQEGIGGAGEEGLDNTQRQPTWPEEQQSQPGTIIEDESLGGAGQAGSGSLSGEVLQKDQKKVFLKLEQGAVLPIEVNQQTTAMDPESQKELKGQQALKKISTGDRISVEVTTEKNKNVATSIQFDPMAGQQQELLGKVASVQGNIIHLEHEGALVPLKTDKETQFQSSGDRQISSARQLKEGDQVRASFKAEGTTNSAKSIELSGLGTGGAFEEGGTDFEWQDPSLPEQQFPDQQQELPEQQDESMQP